MKRIFKRKKEAATGTTAETKNSIRASRKLSYEELQQKLINSYRENRNLRMALYERTNPDRFLAKNKQK